MNTSFKEIVNGRYFWIVFLCLLVIVKLSVENFGVPHQLVSSVPTIKKIAVIIFFISVGYFVLSLLIILITMLISGTYDNWIQKNRETTYGKIVDSFIRPAYISLAIIIYGAYIYFSLTLSTSPHRESAWVLRRWWRSCIIASKRLTSYWISTILKK